MCGPGATFAGHKLARVLPRCLRVVRGQHSHVVCGSWEHVATVNTASSPSSCLGLAFPRASYVPTHLFLTTQRKIELQTQTFYFCKSCYLNMAFHKTTEQFLINACICVHFFNCFLTARSSNCAALRADHVLWPPQNCNFTFVESDSDITRFAFLSLTLKRGRIVLAFSLLVFISFRFYNFWVQSKFVSV